MGLNHDNRCRPGRSTWLRTLPQRLLCPIVCGCLFLKLILNVVSSQILNLLELQPSHVAVSFDLWSSSFCNFIFQADVDADFYILTLT
jgi:hypothetical protein